MANLERLREQRKADALRQLVNDRDRRVFAAFSGVNRLYGKVNTETHRDVEVVPDRYMSVTVRPTPEEMASAPVALHQVFRRLGILATDEATVCIGIFESDKYRNEYEWQVKPVPVTREKVGLFIQYGNDKKCPVMVITADENGREVHGYYYGDEIDEDEGDIGDKARGILEYYAVRTVQDSGELLDEEMVQIYEASCEWMVDLLETRKKSMFFRKLS